jgi:hypothetical protein
MRFVLRLGSVVSSVLGGLLLASCGGGGSESPAMTQREQDQATQAPNTGVCDGLKAPGTTRGLFGLCNAYCVALACPDATSGAAALSAQCKSASPQLLADYNRLKTATDPAMPCVKPPPGCPCWSATELAGVGRSFSPHIVELFPNVAGDSETIALVENRYSLDQFVYGAYTLAQVNDTSTNDQCVFLYADFAPGAPPPTIRVQNITQSQASTCKAAIRGQVLALGREGVSVRCIGNNCLSTP